MKKLWIVDKRFDGEAPSFPGDDLVIDFTGQLDSRDNFLDLSARYNGLRREVREKYIQYISALGNRIIGGKTLKELFLIENSSLWWFNGISQKNAFDDSLIDDVCKTVFINQIVTEKGITSVGLFTNSPWLESLVLNKKRRVFGHILKKFFNRLKLVLYFFRIKIFLWFQTWNREVPKEVDTLFFTFFPVNWNVDHQGRFSNRFFRDIPLKKGKSAYLIFLEKCTAIPKKILQSAFVIQEYIGISDVLRVSFDMRNALKYFLFRKRLKDFFIFENIDLSFPFDWYMWQSVLLEESYFRLIIKGVRKMAQKIKPKQIVNVGEFGYAAKSLIVGGKSSGAKMIWMQHAVISEWKLWYFHTPADFEREDRIKPDFIKFMPVCDAFVFWADNIREKVVRSGFPSDRTTVLGSSRYDYFLEMKESALHKTAHIVLTPSIYTDETVIFCDLALRIKKYFPEKSVVLKLHPRYQSLLKDEVLLKKIERLKKESVNVAVDSIENYYSDQSLFICAMSTVGIEAAYFGAKVISYIPPYHNVFVPDWLEEGTYAYSFEELVEKIKNFAQIPSLNWAKYYLQPGGISERLVNFLEK